ncbi:O-antigen ligase family protein [Aureibaculum conchae]|uniref:O-antigen ligase family protein n=1 Tax=Aureibaculum sp. 2308TA14-22 TaxID=3108392 RepID=UPI003390DAFC
MHKYIFYLLVFIITSDINGFLSKTFETVGFLSIFILLLASYLFVIVIGNRLRISSMARFMIFFIFFWLIYGALIYYTKGIDYGDPIFRIRSYLPSILILYVLHALFLNYLYNNRLDSIIKLITISLIFNALAIVFTNDSSFLILTGDRASGFIASVNQAGYIAVTGQIFTLFCYLNYPNIRNRYKILLILCYFLTLRAGFMTFSKGAIVNSVIVFIIFLFFINRNHFKTLKEAIKWKSNKIIFRIILLLAIIIGPIYWSSLLLELTKDQIARLNQVGILFLGQIDSETTTGRIELVDIAIDFIQSDSFLGRGLDTFHRLGSGELPGPHNEFLLILGEIGIIGLLLYISFYVVVLFNIFRLDSGRSKFLILSLTVVLILDNMVSHNVFFNKFAILIIAFICAFVQYKKIPKVTV